MKREDARQRLIQATVEVIERRGLASVTVRAVAAAAEMNIAAVSYHFGSKVDLIEAVLEGTIRHTVDDAMAILEGFAQAPEPTLLALLTYLHEGALRYPRLSKAHLHTAFTQDDYTGPFPTLFGPVMDRLRHCIESHVPGLSSRAAAHRTVACMAGALFPAFFQGLVTPLGGLDDAPARAEYIGKLASQALRPS